LHARGHDSWPGPRGRHRLSALPKRRAHRTGRSRTPLGRDRRATRHRPDA
jgi:hypothetical protein